MPIHIRVAIQIRNARVLHKRVSMRRARVRSIGDPAQRTRIWGEGSDALEVGRLQDVALVEGHDPVGAVAGVVGAGADGYSTRSPLFDGVGGGGDGEGEEGSGGGSDGSEVLHFDNVWGFVGGMGKRVEG